MQITHSKYFLLFILSASLVLVSFALIPRTTHACPNYVGTAICGYSSGRNGGAIICSGSGRGGGPTRETPVCYITLGGGCRPVSTPTPVLPPQVSVTQNTNNPGGRGKGRGSFIVTSPRGGRGGGNLTPADISITANPTLIQPGSDSTIAWTSVGVQSGSCGVTGPSFNETGESGSELATDIQGTSVYTLSCLSEDDEAVSDSATVRIVPQWQEF